MAETDTKIDIVLFTGDLVQGGSDPDSFAIAKIAFLDQTAATCGISLDKVFLVPGNHDIDRDKVHTLRIIESGVSATLVSTSEVNGFIDSTISRSENTDVFAKLANYNSWYAGWRTSSVIFECPFFTAYRATCPGVTAGIAGFNTAWRATGRDKDYDRGKLVLGERAVELAIKHLSDCAIRIAFFHHPMDWLLPFDQVACEPLLQSSFHIIASGHLHRQTPEYRQSPSGHAVFSGCGSIFHKRDYFNGYQLIQYDRDSGRVVLTYAGTTMTRAESSRRQ